MDFEEMYRLYFKDVYLFILAMSRDAHTAEEITQETFYKALRGIRSFREDCSPKTWLCQIAKNCYLTHQKRQKRMAPETPEERAQTSAVPSGGNESAESIFLRKDEALSIYRVLHCLEEPYKEVFTLRTLGDLSFREIGEIFGRKEGWARVVYHRARMKIIESVVVSNSL